MLTQHLCKTSVRCQMLRYDTAQPAHAADRCRAQIGAILDQLRAARGG